MSADWAVYDVAVCPRLDGCGKFLQRGGIVVPDGDVVGAPTGGAVLLACGGGGGGLSARHCAAMAVRGWLRVVRAIFFLNSLRECMCVSIEAPSI